MENKVLVVIINGVGGSGKSQFCTMAKEYCDTLEGVSAVEVSTIDYIKRIFAMTTGWNGKTKSAKVRQALHDLKCVYEKYNNSPNKEALNDAKTFIKDHSDDINIVFCNIREADSIKKFITLAEKEGYKIIKMKVISNMETNEAPDVIAEIDKTEYDIVIDNTGTLDDLQIKAKKFVDNIVFDFCL